jgi:DNA transformation protein
LAANLRPMGETATVLAFAVDLFSDMGPVEARRMFGGAGLYADDVMFGLIDDDVIYLKVDETLKADLAAAGSRSWIYTERKGLKAGIPQETSYWSLPESALDDPEEACAWGLRSLAVARVIKATKPVPRRRPKFGAPRP